VATDAESASAVALEHSVIILGVVLLILGFIFGVPILWTLGIILAIIGVVLYIAGSTGRRIGPRKSYW
jgi:hypothetical protein